MEINSAPKRLNMNKIKNVTKIKDAISIYEEFNSSNYFREVCGMTVSDRAISVQTLNNPSMVEFDFFKAMEKVAFEGKNNLTMVHTHPDGVNGMSSIDFNMSCGWPIALGIPIRYAIVTSEYYIEYKLFRENNKTLKPLLHKIPLSKMESICEGHFITFCRMLYALSISNCNFIEDELINDFNFSYFGECV